MSEKNGFMKALKCRECGTEYPLEATHVCEFDFGPLEVVYDYDRIKKSLTRESIASRAKSMWRYRELLPVAGEPTGDRPPELARAELNWVPVAAPADRVAAVVQAYSAVPGEHRNTWRMAAAQYIPEGEMMHADWMRRAGGLTRPQTELVAARVAQLRECFY